MSFIGKRLTPGRDMEIFKYPFVERTTNAMTFKVEN